MKKALPKYFILFPLVLLIIGSFTDLALSQAIYSPNNQVCLILDYISEVPFALIASFCGAGLFITFNSSKKWKRIFWKTGYFAASLLFSLIAAFVPFYHSNNLNMLWISLCFILFFSLCFLAARYFAKTKPIDFKKASIVGFYSIIIILVVVTGIKFSWGRVRYRDLVDNLALFTPWFKPMGITGHQSFPSGHSANTMILIWLSLLPSFIPKLKNKATLFGLLGFIFSIIVMFSRIVVGAHFLTDTAMGAIISMLIFYLVLEIVNRRYSSDTPCSTRDALNKK